MSEALVGRDAELAAIRGFLDRSAGAARALVIDGEAGIGKSALWQVGVADARARFGTVLASRPAEAEQGLAHVVLSDLFANIGPQVLEGLSPPRRRALEAALLLEDPAGQDVDPRALGAALVDVLPALASGHPLVVAIDDDQWADGSSIASLSFALRRMRGEPILLLVARRDGATHTGLEEVLDLVDVERLRVGPMSLGALGALIHARLGTALPRPALIRVLEASGGNPLFAIEVARRHPPAALVDPLHPLDLPSDLERLIALRVEFLPPETRAALLVAAAHGRPTIVLLEQLGMLSVLGPALEAGIVERSEGAVRFTHPLMSSVLYQGASDADRRAAHRRLAGQLPDPIHRARHLARATEGPDEGVAGQLESSARLARRRGAPIAAAELAELAARLTPLDALDVQRRRAMLAARAHLAAGAADRARDIAEAQRASAGPEARAEALVLLAELAPDSAAVTLLEEALAGLASSPRLAAEIHCRLADTGRLDRGRDWAAEHAREARRLAGIVHDDGLLADALAIAAVLRFEHLEPGALELAREAHRLATAVGEPRLLRQARWAVGHLLTWMRRVGEAREWVERAVDDIGDSDELSRFEMLWYLALIELWAGHWDCARTHAEAFVATAAQYGVEQAHGHFAIGLIALHQGQHEEARMHANRGLELSVGYGRAHLLLILGLADLWDGRPELAIESLATVTGLTRERGLDDPGQAFAWAEQVEALLQLGRIDEAEAITSDYESRARRVRRAWALAQARLARGQIAAARGKLDAAVRELDAAVAAHDEVGDPFGRARAMLALGGVRRRQRQKRMARLALEAALEAFDELGATKWAARARAELGRLGGRRRMDDLSPSERRVAELAADGRTNREIAAALFLSQRTVASHLTQVYGKLGIRSRTELARHLTHVDAGTGAGKVQTS